MAKQAKFYVVWLGRKPGIYREWSECKEQIEGFENAKYKSFESLSEAEKAFAADWKSSYKLAGKRSTINSHSKRPTGDFIAVDAACSGNPGLMEYRGVFRDGLTQIFHQGPFPQGTNNIGEFLAIVHALALQTAKKTNYPIYSDSMNALAWVRKKKCGTKLAQTPVNEPIFDLIDRAESWLASNKWDIPLFKWETAQWGEIPADFGRK
jgi:ribonuclease HI